MADALRVATRGSALARWQAQRVASLLELVARATIRKSNQSARLLDWLKLVPDDLIRARPVLSTYYAFALLGTGEMDNAAARLRDALLHQDNIEVQLHATKGRLWTRVSTQIYNDRADIERLADAVLSRTGSD